MGALTYTLIGLAALVVVIFLIYTVIFIKHRKNLNADYKYKQKMNFYISNRIGSNLKAIESLVSHNEDLLPILEYLKMFSIHFDGQVELTKKKLMGLSKRQKSMQLGFVKHQLKELETNFVALKQLEDTFYYFSVNSGEYKKTANQLAVQIMNVTSSMLDFFHKNLVMNYDNPVFKNLAIIISKTNEEITHETLHVNNETFDELIKKQLKTIRDMFNIIRKLYICDVLVTRLEVIITELKQNFVEHKETKIHKRNIIMLSKQLQSASESIVDIKKLLTNLELEKAEKIIFEKITNLEKAKINLTKYAKSIEMINQYSLSFNKAFIMFEERFNTLINAIDRCRELFSKDESINKIITNISTNLKSMKVSYDGFTNDKKVSKYTPVEELDKIISLIFLYQNIEREFEHLINEIKDKSHNFINLINKISDNKLKLIQIRSLVKEKQTRGIDAVSAIEEDIQKLNNYEQKLTGDYASNWTNTIIDVDNISKEVNKLISSVSDKMILEEIAKKLQIYCNRFYFEQFEVIILNIKKMYEQGNYEDAIEAYIDFLTKMKKISKK